MVPVSWRSSRPAQGTLLDSKAMNSPVASISRPTGTLSSSERCSGTSPRPAPSSGTALVARLGVRAGPILTAACVIGRDFDLDLLTRVTETAEDDLIDVLDAAAASA